MGFYASRVLPRLIEIACGQEPIATLRREVVPKAEGRVLEIGSGSGLNLGHLDPARVEMLWALEPSEGMRRLASARVGRVPFEVRYLDLPGEEIPLEDESVDTVLTTFTLCTIPGVDAALGQMRRVLKPSGRLIFAEHGNAPDDDIRRWQRRIEPVWKRVAGGCHLTRPIPELIEHAGFRLRELEQGYAEGPAILKFGGYHYWGTAARS